MTALLLLCATTAYHPPHQSHARSVKRDAQRTYTLTDAEGATDLLEVTTKAEGRTFVLDGSKMLTLYECSFYEGKLGYQVWPAALAGAAWACHNKALFEGKRVLELGSGTGVAGLACAALGARAVRLTDLPERLDLLRRNATRNRGHAFGVDVDVAPYAWGDKFGAMALAADGVDVVVGADVCYAQGMVPPLVASVLALMDHAEVCILACERHEPVAYAALKNALAERLDASAVAAVASADVEIVVFRRRRAAAAAANVS